MALPGGVATVARMLDLLTDGLFVLDTEWRITYVNETAARSLGHPDAELLGSVVWDHLTDGYDGEVGRRYRNAMATQTAVVTEVFSTPLQAWFELRLFPAPDALTVVYRDVDARRRSEDAHAALLAAERAARADAEAARLDAESARQQLGFLARASAELAGSLREHDVLDTLTRLVVSDWVDWCCVYLAQGGELVEATAHHRDPAADALLGNKADGGPAPAEMVAVYREGVAQLVVDLTADARRGSTSRELSERVRDLSLRSALYVPLATSQGRVGVLALFRADGPPLGDDDLTIAEQLAGRAALAIQNARLYEHERSVAEALQLAVLPEQLPAVPGWELAARYLPAGIGATVGGDFYDAYLAFDRLVLTLGDVAGHGLRAAAVMGQVRNALRAFTLEHIQPEAVMIRARRLLRTREPDELVTMLFGALDPETGRLEWATAGHPPPVLVAADGTARQLDHPGCPPLGSPPIVSPPPSTQVVTIQPGETIVWFTDGLVERRGEDLEDGFARLVAVAPRLDPRRPDSIDAVLAELVPGRQRPDDVCLLILRRNESTA